MDRKHSGNLGSYDPEWMFGEEKFRNVLQNLAVWWGSGDHSLQPGWPHIFGPPPFLTQGTRTPMESTLPGLWRCGWMSSKRLFYMHRPDLLNADIRER